MEDEVVSFKFIDIHKAYLVSRKVHILLLLSLFVIIIPLSYLDNSRSKVMVVLGPMSVVYAVYVARSFSWASVKVLTKLTCYKDKVILHVYPFLYDTKHSTEFFYRVESKDIRNVYYNKADCAFKIFGDVVVTRYMDINGVTKVKESKKRAIRFGAVDEATFIKLEEFMNKYFEVEYI